jgi:hypothetical protein
MHSQTLLECGASQVQAMMQYTTDVMLIVNDAAQLTVGVGVG